MVAGLAVGSWAAVASATSSSSMASLSVSGLSIPAGGYQLLLITASGGSLACNDTLRARSALQWSDGFLSTGHGIAVTSSAPPAVSPSPSPCGWASLAIDYSYNKTTCATQPPPPRPPAPLTPVAVPISFVSSLAALVAALADPTVTGIEIGESIQLAGAELVVAARPDGTLRTLLIEGTHACSVANASTPLCVLDGGGLSRLFLVDGGGSAGSGPIALTLAYLALQNGAAPTGESGGCVLMTCPGCSLTVTGAVFLGCSAATGAGGAVALYVPGTDANVLASNEHYVDPRAAGALHPASSGRGGGPRSRSLLSALAAAACAVAAFLLARCVGGSALSAARLPRLQTPDAQPASCGARTCDTAATFASPPPPPHSRAQ